MKVRITPFAPKGEITAPPSKSVAMRYILLAAVADGKTIIENVGDSADVAAAIGCVKSLGASVDYDGRSVTVRGIKTLPQIAEFDFGECGFLLRTVIPLANALGVKFSYRAGGNLSSRPVKPLFNALSESLFKTENGEYYGKATAGKFVIDGSQSSQFISGLLIAAAAMKGVSRIKITGEKVSDGYIETTLAALKTFGVKTEKRGDEITVYGGKIVSPKRLVCEGDCSSVAYFLALGAIKGSVTVKGLNVNSKQPDKAITDILTSYGANVKISGDEITVEAAKIKKPVNVSVKDCPDLAQTIAVLAANADGESVIKDVGRLKIKESDRLKAIIKTLEAAGIKSESVGDDLHIFGGAVKGGTFYGGNDHRTVMSQAILAATADGESVIAGAEAVKKSFPSFFENLIKAGGSGNVRISR